MIVTAWKNGTPTTGGAGYGVRLAADDCDRYFRKEWDTIELELEATHRLSKSMWQNRPFGIRPVENWSMPRSGAGS